MLYTKEHNLNDTFLYKLSKYSLLRSSYYYVLLRVKEIRVRNDYKYLVSLQKLANNMQKTIYVVYKRTYIFCTN